MACAYKECTQLWRDFQKKLAAAKNKYEPLSCYALPSFRSREDLDEVKESLTKELESDLIFLGFVGIQDEIQEEVPDTITKLKAANIKFAMLTGDRTMTAVNVAKKSMMLEEDANYHVLDIHSGTFTRTLI